MLNQEAFSLQFLYSMYIVQRWPAILEWLYAGLQSPFYFLDLFFWFRNHIWFRNQNVWSDSTFSFHCLIFCLFVEFWLQFIHCFYTLLKQVNCLSLRNIKRVNSGGMFPNTPLALAASRYCCSPDWTSRTDRIKRSSVLRDMKISRRMARNKFCCVAANSILYGGSTEATGKNELCWVVQKQKDVGEDTVRRTKFLRKPLH